jgi:hypothetical protein
MRDLNKDELGSVYGAGGRGKYCKGGSKGKGKGGSSSSSSKGKGGYKGGSSSS